MPNPFLFHEIITPDPEALCEFYQQIFAWRTELAIDNDVPFFLVYYGDYDVPIAVLSKDLGLTAVKPGAHSYIEVDSVDDFESRAADLGGAVVMRKIVSVLNGWKFPLAVIADPQGNEVGVMEPITYQGDPVEPLLSPIKFNEIISENPSLLARDFYRELFDWQIENGGTDQEPFYTINTGQTQTPQGGIAETSDKPGYNKLTSFYIEVDDVDTTLENISASGGRVAMPNTQVPLGDGLVNIAMFTDPQNNQIGLISAV